jgi:Tfp pilus assembly protein PilF
VVDALRLEQVKAQPDPKVRRAALNGMLRQGQRVLLALDNLEPGLDAEAVLNTLAIREHTVVMLTARQTLAPHLLEAYTVALLDEAPAMQLFLERLRQADPERPAPDADEQQMLTKMVAQLGGLPLAIQLTAAYVGKQKPMLKQLLEELEAAPLNAAALRDPQLGLVQCFDRSWKVLASPQKHLFAGLSLLAGASFPRNVAVVLSQVAGAGTLDKPRSKQKAEDDLNALISYALVEPLEGGRLRLHPLLREYAGEKLTKLSQERCEQLGEVMIAYWLAYAEAHPGYDGMDALEAEAPGLLGALAWAHEYAHHQEVLALTHAISQAWWIRARRTEELQFYPWAVEAAAALGVPQEQLWAVHQQAVKYRQIGQLTEARQGFELALALALQLGDLNAERVARHHLAVLDGQTGQKDKARQGLEQALALALQLGDPNAERDERHSLATLALESGRKSEARQELEQALALAVQLGNPAAEQAERHALAVLEAESGQDQEAAVNYERALLLARQLGDPVAESNELRGWGFLLCQQNERARGRDMIEQSMAISERLNDVYNIGKCQEYLASIEAQQGNREEAIAHCQEALRRYEQVQSSDAEKIREALRRLDEET